METSAVTSKVAVKGVKHVEEQVTVLRVTLAEHGYRDRKKEHVRASEPIGNCRTKEEKVRKITRVKILLSFL